jgi:hypothetical protein
MHGINTLRIAAVARFDQWFEGALALTLCHLHG